MSKVYGKELTDEQIAAAEEAGATETELRHIFSLRARAAEFTTAFDNLLSWEDAVAGTELEAEYRDLVDRGFNLRERVQTLLNQIGSAFDTVVGWFRTAISWLPGVDGLHALRSGTLGVVWFVPVAAIAVVLGVLGLWLSDYAKFSRRFAEQQRIARELESQGVAPIEAQRQAAAIVADTTPGFGAALAGPLGWVAAAGIGFVLWQAFQSSR